jgi:tetratricopeptide (TPR) repeat protein
MVPAPKPAARLPLLACLACLAFLGAGLGAQANEAQAAFKEGRYEDAVALSLQVVEKDPAAVEGYLVLWWSYLKESNWESALSYALKAYNQHRYDYRLAEILGRASYSLGRNDESLRYFQEYVTLLPEGTQAGPIYFLMGELYIRLGRFSHADISFTTAVNFMPTDAYAWFRLGYSRERAGDYPNALAAYDQSLKLNPGLKDSSMGKQRVEQLMRG